MRVPWCESCERRRAEEFKEYADQAHAVVSDWMNDRAVPSREDVEKALQALDVLRNDAIDYWHALAAMKEVMSYRVRKAGESACRVDDYLLAARSMLEELDREQARKDAQAVGGGRVGVPTPYTVFHGRKRAHG